MRLCEAVAGMDETPSAVTPASVPHAPLNTTGYLMAQTGVPLFSVTLCCQLKLPEGTAKLLLFAVDSIMK